MELSKLQKNAQTLFKDRCDIKRYRFEKAENGVSNAVLYDVYNDVMCRISYLTSEPNEETLTAFKTELKIKLFLPIEYKIESGDIFIVYRNGESKSFRAASQSRIYSFHQEIEAVIYDKNP